MRGARCSPKQTLPDCNEPSVDNVGKVAGFSLHAGVAARKDERKKLERLCRYIARPAVSEKRLSLSSNGYVRYELKTPYRDGTTHVIFEPMDFIAFSHEGCAFMLPGETSLGSPESSPPTAHTVHR